MKSLMDILTGGKKIDRPIFRKEFEDSSELITELEVITSSVKVPAIKDEIAMDIGFIKAGDLGEKNVYYEIKNSFLPMIVLHNVAIQYEDYKAQMDFIVITKNFICILETKKLNGNILINTDGDFVRSFTNRYSKVYKKEGMYSPVSQNQRHVRILENMLKQEKVIKNTPVLSLVVIANPKSIIDMKYAKKEIKDQIVKFDQLTPRIKNMMIKNDATNLSESTMSNIADFIYSKHTEFVNPFIPKYLKHVVVENHDVPVIDMELTEGNLPQCEEKITIEEPCLGSVSIQCLDNASISSPSSISLHVDKFSNSSNEPIVSAKESTIGHTHDQTDRHTYGHTDGHTDGHTHDQTGSQTDNHTNGNAESSQAANTIPTSQNINTNSAPDSQSVKTSAANSDVDKAKIREALTKFRLEQSRTENVKAYFIFNNAQMEGLVEKLPSTIDELLACDGFGPGKAQKYGEQILRICSGR